MELTAIESSFWLVVTRTHDGRFVVEVADVEVDTVSRDELAQAAWSGIQELLDGYRWSGSNAADLAAAES